MNARAQSSGRPAVEWASEAIQIMVDELAEARVMIDRRYDELKSGAVESVDGEEFSRSFASRRSHRSREREGEVNRFLLALLPIACHAATTFPYSATAGQYSVLVTEDPSPPFFSHSLIFDGPDGPKAFALPFPNGLDYLVLGSVGRLVAFGSYLGAALYVIDYHTSPPFVQIVPGFFEYPEDYGPPSDQTLVPIPYIQYRRLFLNTRADVVRQIPVDRSWIRFSYDTGIEMGESAIPEPGYLFPAGLGMLAIFRRFRN